MEYHSVDLRHLFMLHPVYRYRAYNGEKTRANTCRTQSKNYNNIHQTHTQEYITIQYFRDKTAREKTRAKTRGKLKTNRAALCDDMSVSISSAGFRSRG